jgi:negative regulator of sigma-B (phosphoserine phosphatase)
VGLLHECHLELRGTRGIALSLAAIDEKNSTMSWLAIGNVRAGSGARARPGGCDRPLSLRGGIVGRTLPPVTPRRCRSPRAIRWSSPRTASIRGHELHHRVPPQRHARPHARRHFRGDDDGLVMIVVYGGNAP